MGKNNTLNSNNGFSGIEDGTVNLDARADMLKKARELFFIALKGGFADDAKRLREAFPDVNFKEEVRMAQGDEQVKTSVDDLQEMASGMNTSIFSKYLYDGKIEEAMSMIGNNPDVDYGDVLGRVWLTLVIGKEQELADNIEEVFQDTELQIAIFNKKEILIRNQKRIGGSVFDEKVIDPLGIIKTSSAEH